MLSKNYIAPSILAADFCKLGQEVLDVVEAGADWIHIDVMDAHFVPNITFGPDVVRALRPKTKAVFDAHLMIENCDQYIDRFAEAGCDIITIHAEANNHIHRSLNKIRSLDKKAGLAFNPATPLTCLPHLLDDIDLILIMTVNPGFGGQSFISSMLKKIEEAREMIGERAIALEVDGGIGPDNIKYVAQAGANVFVAGSAIYKNGNKALYKERINILRSRIETNR